MNDVVTRFWHDESGATSIEYALIGSLIAVVIVAALTTIGTKLSATFSTISNKLGT